MTALNWTQRTRRAFHPTQIPAALEYLQVQEPQRSELLEHALQFARDLNHAELAESLRAGTPEGT